jgi:tetratricopeptide (TPR) repeat protein
VHGERALALATAAGDAELAARCLNVLGYIYNGTYQAERARRASQDSSTRYAALGNPAMESDSLAQLACAYIRLGQARQALDAGRRSQQRAEAVENYWGIANGALQVAVALAEIGDLGQAHQAAVGAVSMVEERRITFMTVLAKITLANVLRGLFQLDPASRLLEEILALQPPQSVALRAAVDLCAVHALRQDWASARELLGAGPLQAHPLFLAGRCLWLEAEALLHAGDAERARDYVADWGRAIGDNPRAGLDYARATATVLSFQGQPAQAVEVLQRAERSAASLDLPGEHWQILAALARALEGAGDTSAAREARDQARTVVNGLAATLGDETARQTFLNGANGQIDRRHQFDPNQ